MAVTKGQGLARTDAPAGLDSFRPSQITPMGVVQAKVVFVSRDGSDSAPISDVLDDASIVILVASDPELQLGDAHASDSDVPRITEFGDLRIDPWSHEVRWRSVRLAVTEQELGILAALIGGRGSARSYYELSDGAHTYGDHDWLRSAIKRLRRKLQWAGSEVEIEAVRGYGFRLRGQRVDAPQRSDSRSQRDPQLPRNYP